MKHTLETYIEENDAGWRIKEKLTNQIIAKSVIEDVAITRMNFMEKGGAFAGFTPLFMIETGPIDLDR